MTSRLLPLLATAALGALTALAVSASIPRSRAPPTPSARARSRSRRSGHRRHPDPRREAPAPAAGARPHRARRPRLRRGRAAPPGDLARLTRRRVRLRRRASPTSSRAASRSRTSTRRTPPRVDASPMPSGRDDYRTLDDYNADMSALAKKHPALVNKFKLKRPSLDGRPNLRRRDQPRVKRPTEGAHVPADGCPPRARVAERRARDGVRDRPREELRHERAHHRPAAQGAGHRDPGRQRRRLQPTRAPTASTSTCVRPTSTTRPAAPAPSGHARSRLHAQDCRSRTARTPRTVPAVRRPRRPAATARHRPQPQLRRLLGRYRAPRPRA